MRKAALGAIALSLLMPAYLFSLDGAALEALAQASVMIQPMKGSSPAKLTPIPATGSGTLVDNEIGLVVTNYHVVQDGLKAARYAKVFVSVDLSDPPVECFIFETVIYSKAKDVAVLRYVKDIEGAPKKLADIPPIDIGKWGLVGGMHLNDEISIIGYPAYSEDVSGGKVTLTITNGKVAGFIKDEPDAPDFDRAWIKTDALASWGNSGGTAIDKEGRFIGIPTQIMPDPKGARLGLLRPVDMVRPFVEAILARPDYPALTTESVFLKGGPSAPAEKPAEAAGPSAPEGGSVPPDAVPGVPTMGDLRFGTELAGGKKLKDPGTAFVASRVKMIYASAPYSGFAKGDDFREAWFQDGKLVYENRFKWKLAESGDYLTSLSHNGASMPKGEYTLVLEYKGVEVKRASFSLRDVVVKEVKVTGRVLDAAGRKPIAGASIVVLKKGAKVADYLAKKDESMVLETATTGDDGKFALKATLEAGASYAVIATAEGYVDVTDDRGFTLSVAEKSAKDFTVTLAKKK